LESEEFQVGEGVVTRMRAKSSAIREKKLRIRVCEAKMLEIGENSKVFVEIVYDGNKMSSDVFTKSDKYIWDQDFELLVVDMMTPIVVSVNELDSSGLHMLDKGIVDLETLKRGENDLWFDLPKFSLHIIVEPIEFGL